MCIRKCVLHYGEKIFNILLILGFIAGAASGVTTATAVGGKQGWLAGAMEVILSWSGTLLIALVVYSLLDIRHTLANKQAVHEKKPETGTEGCNHSH